MVINASEQIEKFQEFIDSNYKKQLHNAIRESRKSLVIDFAELSKFDPDLAESLLEEPEETLKAAEISLDKFDLPKDVVLRVRFENLPKSQITRIKNIRSNHIEKLIVIEGIVRQASDVRPQVTSARFECPSCGNIISILQLDTKFKEPSRCSCGRKGRFRLISKDLVDAQRLIIEESSEELEGGSQPKRISVFLKEDLVDPKMEKKATPGSKVRINGIVKEVPILLGAGIKSIRSDLVIESNYIEPIEETFEDIEISPEEEAELLELGRDPRIVERLVKSIAPSIYGHEDIKEALILQLMGGVKKDRKDGTKTRGDMHILLIGDPGSGKSELLQFISKIAPKGRLVSGKGVTGAGLCVAPNSLILTNPGKIYNIKSLVEEKLRNNCKHFREDILQAKDPRSNKKIFTLGKNLKIEPSKISQFWKIKAPKRMITLSTKSGKTITVTPNTKLYTISNGTPCWKEVSSFKIGSYIATSRKLKFKNKNKQLVITLLKSNPVIYGVKKHVKKIVKILCFKYSMNKKELAKYLSIKENNLYYNWVNEKARGNIKFKKLIKLANKSKYPLKKIAKDIKSFSLYNGHKIKLPVYINKDLLYFAGLVAGDGDLHKSKNTVSIRLSNNSKEIQNKFVSLSKKLFNVKPNISSKKTSKRAEARRFASKLVFEILNSLGIPSSPKSHKMDMSNVLLNLPNDHLASFLEGYFDTDGGPVERKKKGSCYIECSTTSKIFTKKLQLILLRFDIHTKLLNKKPRPNKKIASKHRKYVLKIVGKQNLLNFQKNIDFSINYKKQKLDRIINKIGKTNTNIDVIPEIQSSLRELRIKNNLTSKEMFGYKTSSCFLKKFNISKNNLKKIISKLKNKNLSGMHRLNLLANSDIFWEKIVNINVIKPAYDYVYDLTVEKSHNFIVNGFIVHNTATVVRDEFLRGWALEAGALVLSNKGFCIIDELDKVNPEDIAAMHQALEQQIITISKANIQATLRAETTVLAAANPKLGRFDPYQLVAEQINMPPTLINRFDLIFPIKDIPSRDNDTKIASHILNLQQNPTTLKYDIPPEKIKRYISYVKQKIFPKLTDGAIEEIKNFYVTLRNTGTTEEAAVKPIPITPRQLEALVRLAEGSARIRLSDTVTRKDAKKAINILKRCLMDVSMDFETGTIDIDRISTGISAAQRSKIIIIKEVITELEKKIGKTIPIEDVIAEAAEKDISTEKVEEVIERLKRSGDLFEPKRGFIQRI